MRFIDLVNHRPGAEWADGLKSDALTKQLIELHMKGDIAARNKLIDDNSKHWGQIKAWLLGLSNNKCWFSEARDIFSHIDVEHFRPKLEAKGLDGTTRDGYWWLAFDYHNYRACGNVGNRKKGGWFPLQDGSTFRRTTILVRSRRLITSSTRLIQTMLSFSLLMRKEKRFPHQVFQIGKNDGLK